MLLVDASRFVPGAAGFLDRWLARSTQRRAVVIADEGHDGPRDREIRLPLPFEYDDLVRALAALTPPPVD